MRRSPLKVSKPIDPIKLRKQGYMPIGDQLDAIIKTFAHLESQGIDIGENGRDLIGHSQAVKDRFIKK